MRTSSASCAKHTSTSSATSEDRSDVDATYRDADKIYVSDRWPRDGGAVRRIRRQQRNRREAGFRRGRTGGFEWRIGSWLIMGDAKDYERLRSRLAQLGASIPNPQFYECPPGTHRDSYAAMTNRSTVGSFCPRPDRHRGRAGRPIGKPNRGHRRASNRRAVGFHLHRHTNPATATRGERSA